MKHRMKIFIVTISILTVSVFALAGCDSTTDSSSSKSTGTTATVDDVINDQIDSTEDTSDTDISEDASDSAAADTDETETAAADADTTADETVYENVDYDLTEMSSDMVYATVYDMMANPSEYTGKTFRMNGSYYSFYYEATDQYYHYCIVADATACCSQGLEFVWGDGSHAYPDEYPEEYAEVTVTGTFETYREEGDDTLYCHLANATLETA
ncbi:MAG: hypothetical protein LUF32_06050 [Clostridiales bacterium]|nr:hypothetical protein [Clostridiales bacterium]